MLARIESRLRRLRRRFSRTEWAIRRLRLSTSEGTGPEPGLLLVQIDGLSRRQLERALARGRLPFVKRLIDRQGYELATFYSGLPSTTPAVQAELHYGVRCAVPGFSFLDRAQRRVSTMYRPDCAEGVEALLQNGHAGLLAGGSSWSNVYTGGAAPEESHFSLAGCGLSHFLRWKVLIGTLTLIPLHLASVARLVVMPVVEIFIALWDMVAGVIAGERVFKEMKFVLSRIFACIGLREVVLIGAKIDLARGLPVIHVNFLGYDEQSHRRGPSSAFAHWSLKGIDAAVEKLYWEAYRSHRRDYQVWLFSDHGQEAARSFKELHPGGVEAAVRACWQDMEKEQGDAEGALPVVSAMGPVGHVYLPRPVSWVGKRELARSLIAAGVPRVLFKGPGGEVEWVYEGGRAALPVPAEALLPHPGLLKRAVAEDLAALCRHPNAGDLVLLGWSPSGQALTFPIERGAHGGPGPEETQGFALLPRRTRRPEAASDFLRPETLRAAALHLLGREPLPAKRPSAAPASFKLRLMTYNVHGCLGMDGRTSPQRIARVIAMNDVDIAALQEVDVGRSRSKRHDQARLIAAELCMHACFCPTVVVGEELYGHALLSRFPIEVVRMGLFAESRVWPWEEPRGVLWARIAAGGVAVHMASTHLSVSRRVGAAQMVELMGKEWVGPLLDGQEPLILCGDFNMPPDTIPYRAATLRLRDVQVGLKRFKPLKTFAAIFPFWRIDHIFVSRHFEVEKVQVPLNHLTRIASDHLPLIADIRFDPRPPSTLP